MSNVPTRGFGRKSHQTTQRASHATGASRLAADSWMDPADQTAREGLVHSSSILGEVVTAGALAAGSVSANKLSIGMSSTGNLISDAGWEWYALGTTTFWTVDSPWLVQATAITNTYHRGKYRLRLNAPTTVTAEVTSDYIGVGPASEYSLAAQFYLQTMTAGSFSIVVRQFDSSKVAGTVSTLKSWTVDNIYAEVETFLIHGNSVSKEGVEPNLLLDSGTAYIKIEYAAAGLSAANVFVVSNSLVYGPVAQLDATPAHVDGGVSIDRGGIIIYDGKLIFKDQYGSTALTGTGFGAAWEDFLTLGLYNGNFARANTTAETADYWTLVNGDIAWNVAVQGDSNKLRYAIATGATSVSSKAQSALVPVTAGRTYLARVNFIWTGGGNRQPKVYIRLRYYDRSLSLLGTYTATRTYTTMTLGFNESLDIAEAASGSYARVDVEVENLGGASGTDYIDIYWVELGAQPIDILGSINPSAVNTGALTATSVESDTYTFNGRYAFLPARIEGFMVDNPAANTASTQMGRFATGNTAGYLCRPYTGRAGRVVALMWRKSNAITAGSFTLYLNKNGSNAATVVTLNNASADEGTAILGTPVTFDNADGIGVNWSSDASYAPTTLDWAVDILVEYELL